MNILALARTMTILIVNALIINCYQSFQKKMQFTVTKRTKDIKVVVLENVNAKVTTSENVNRLLIQRGISYQVVR